MLIVELDVRCFDEVAHVRLDRLFIYPNGQVSFTRLCFVPERLFDCIPIERWVRLRIQWGCVEGNDSHVRC